MAEKHRVVSTRLTEADYGRVRAKREELKLGWDEFLTGAVSAHYDLGLEGLPKKEQPKMTGEERKAARIKSSKKDRGKKAAKEGKKQKGKDLKAAPPA